MPSHWSWNACRAVACGHLLDGNQEGLRQEVCIAVDLDEPNLCPLVTFCMSEGSEWELFKMEQLRLRDENWKRRAEAVQP